MSSIGSRLYVITVVLCLGSIFSGCGYNTIPTLDEQAKARWSDVQNQYQRRADLIPNLVATVQGYAKQEKDVLTAVIEARDYTGTNAGKEISRTVLMSNASAL